MTIGEALAEFASLRAELDEKIKDTDEAIAVMTAFFREAFPHQTPEDWKIYSVVLGSRLNDAGLEIRHRSKP